MFFSPLQWLSHLGSATPWRLILSIGTAILSTCLLASSQQPAPPATQPAANETNAQSLAIWITARDHDDKPSELSASDLQVKIDGKPASVSDTRRLRPGLCYCLLLDNSGSTRHTLQAQKDRATALLSTIPQAGRDYGVLVNFNDSAYVDAEGTDPKKLLKALDKAGSRGGTALYDAMIACSDLLSKHDLPKNDLSKNDLSKSPLDALRLMFIFSDGDDNASNVSLEAVEHAVISAQVRVYALEEKDTASPNTSVRTRGPETLRRLSEISGGKHFPPGKKMEPEQIAADISADLASLYAVTLTSDQTLTAGRFYKLEVKSGRKNIAITAPRQYFVPAR
jgi:VWFA-related protein